ncbi:MAG: glycosyltransferase [Myxococcaceae bacterium]
MTWLLLAWALLALGVTLTALVRTRRAAPATAVRADALHPVVVLRPFDVPSPQELANLSTPLPPGVRQIVLSPFRPRLPAGVEWLPSDPPRQNRKLGHLHYALSVLSSPESEGAASDEVDFPHSPLQRVLIVDADVRLDDALLSDLLGALDQGADAAWASPRPEAAGLSRGLLVQSLHSFDVLDVISAGPKTVCGKALALGPAALELFRALPDCVGEDLELGVKLAEARLEVRLAGHARVPGADASLTASLARFTRWMQVLRAHRPTLFPTVPLFFACTPLLLAFALASANVAVLGAVLLVAALRTVLAAKLEDTARPTFWWLGGEALLLAAWLGSLVRGRVVEWRGRRLVLGAGGVLVPALRRAS